MSRSASTRSGTPPGGAALPDVPGDCLLRAFEELRDELASTVLYLLGRRQDVEDVVQETFLKCWRARCSLDGVQNLRAWIFRVALNTVKDLRKSAWRRKVKPLLLEEEIMQPGSQDAPCQSLDYHEKLESVRAALVGLRSEEKEIFLLRQNGHLTYEEIAELLALPVGTVKTRMRSALQKLRRAIE
jgi:RNA polymerase sigma-70 factor (ECF subfamily)